MVTLPSVNQVALIVHDMSNEGLKPGGRYPNAGEAPGTAEFIANNVKLLEAARRRGMPVFFTGHFLRPDAKDAPRGGRSETMDVLKDGTWGAEIVDELKPLPGEWRIRKGGGFSGFTGTALEKWLRRLGVTTLIVGGAGTGAGVSSTVYAARERDFAVVLASDACNGAGSEGFEAAIFNMSTFAQVGTTDEVVAAMDTAPDATAPDPDLELKSYGAVSLPGVKHIGLIMHDMSNDALKPGGKYPAAEAASKDPAVQAYVQNNVRLLEAARKRGIAVFHTGHYLRPDYKDVAPGGNSARVGALQANTWGAEPIEELAPTENEWRIRKGGGYSAFTGSPLDKWLRRLGITTLIIGGAGTHAGVEATVRDMREYDYNAVIATDACSAAGSEHHAASMRTLTFAQRVTTEEIVAALEMAAD
jgi:nicotinamidase-related amidase